MKTRRKVLVWGLIGLAAFLALAGVWWTLFEEHKLVFTQQELQQRIDEKLPLTTKNGVTIKSAQLNLEGDKIGLTVEASATKLKSEYAISAATEGELRYDPHRGSFYFKPDALTVLDAKVNETSVADKVDKAIDRWVTSPRLQKHTETLKAEAQALVQELVQKAAVMAFERVPVYTFPDSFKGNAARMMLTDVSVQDGSIVAVLSFWQLTLWVLLYGLVLLAAIGLAVGIVMCPEAAFVLFLFGAMDS